MLHHVFLSYSRKDADMMRRVRDDLRATGLTVWTDEEGMEGIEPGTPLWKDSIERAIEGARVLVVILSPDAKQSQLIREEVRYALHKGLQIYVLVSWVSKRNSPPRTDISLEYIDIEGENYAVGIKELTGKLLERLNAKSSSIEFSPLMSEGIEDLSAKHVSQSSKLLDLTLTQLHIDRVQFSAFYPSLVKSNNQYILMVFAHLRTYFQDIKKIIDRYSALMGEQPTSSTTENQTPVDMNTILTLVPVVHGLSFAVPEQVIVWKPPYQSAGFIFDVPRSLTGNLTGSIRVYQGPLIIGEIPINIEVKANTQNNDLGLNQSGTMRRFEAVFASYSHKDTPVMEYFRRSRENIGQKLLVDIYDLRAGEYWSDSLLKMIDESVVFQLFWSNHSAKSDYCRKEWEYALRYKDKRPRFIQPVWWKSPMPPPPDDLADFHFQKVNLPSLTRLQLTVAQIRGMWKR